MDTFELSNIYKPSDAIFRSISAENPTGEKGKGGMALPGKGVPGEDLGQGWKIRPCKTLEAGEIFTLADITGSGMITHIWMTCEDSVNRNLVLRFYWDGEQEPSVEVPYGDFFANASPERAYIKSMPINVNPRGGFNCYWPMPFRKSCRITVENQQAAAVGAFFYQIDYLEMPVDTDAMYFHCSWRRENPTKYQEPFTILDGVRGKGRFAGVYLFWGQNNNSWWGEGEVKFFMDGDTDFPTYCGTGTEDYFGGAWGFYNRENNGYETFTAPYLGYHQLIKPNGWTSANMRHGLYRWHIADPVFFKESIKITIQALGWRNPVPGRRSRYLPLQDDISATAFWYQSEPHNAFAPLPDRDFRELQ